MAGKAQDPLAVVMAEMGVASKNAAELTNGAIRCSVPECGGIVKAAYILGTKAKVGLCPNREVHDILKAKDETGHTAKVIRDISNLYRIQRARSL